MQSQNIHKNLIDRVLNKISGKGQQPNIKLDELSSFANFVYKVEVIHDQHQQINGKIFLLKIYRDQLAGFSNKQIQNQVLTFLSEAGQNPQIFYSDKNCRIQQFVQGYAPSLEDITEQQMLKIIERLTHLVKLFKNYSQNKSEHFQNQRKIDYMFIQFEKVAEECKQKFADSYQICKQYLNEILDNKIRYNLQKIVPKHTVPTHNDCHFHNVIISNKDKTLYLIDFQFFAPNYRGFELGNFFNQYTIDYYTFQIKQQLELNQKTKDLLIKKYYSQFESNLSLQQAKKQVQVGRLLSHLYWLFIGVKQVRDPRITNDMQYYIKRRYEQFMKFYKRITNNNQQIQH